MSVVLFIPVCASAQGGFPKLPELRRFKVILPETRISRFGPEIERQILKPIKFSTKLPLYVENPSLALEQDALRTYHRVLYEFSQLEKNLGKAFIYDDFTLLPTEERAAYLNLLAKSKHKLDIVARMVDPTRDETLAHARMYVNLGLSTLQQTLASPVQPKTNFAVRPDHQLVESEFFLKNPVSSEGATANTPLPSNLKIAVLLDEPSDLLRMEFEHDAGAVLAKNEVKFFAYSELLLKEISEKKFVPDIILTNTLMNGRMGGYALTAALRENGFSKAIIALEEEVETPEIAQELFAQGFDGLISMPVHFTNPEKLGRSIPWEQRIDEAVANYNHYKNVNGWTH